MNTAITSIYRLLPNVFEGSTFRSFKSTYILFEDSQITKQPLSLFKLNMISSSSLGRYQIIKTISEDILKIIQNKDSIIKSNSFNVDQKKKLNVFLKDELVNNVRKSIKFLDLHIRQGLRDAIIRAGLYKPEGIDDFINHVMDENYAIIPDTGIVERAILTKYIMKKLSIFFSENNFISIPRHIFWELENKSLNKNYDRKQAGYRGLQEINQLKKYPTHIFDLNLPTGYSLISRSGDRPSMDSLARILIREYAKTYSTLVKTCFLTTDRSNFVMSQIEGIDSYFVGVNDLLSINDTIYVPSWDTLFVQNYLPISNIIYELSILFGKIFIVDNIDVKKSNLKITILGDYPGKNAIDWIEGKIKIVIEKGDFDSFKSDFQENSVLETYKDLMEI